MPSVPKPSANDKLGTAGVEGWRLMGSVIDRTVTPTFVGPDAPSVDPMPDRYLWVETGLGSDGTGFTLWIEDGT